jgi:hypothetical protein
MIWKNRYSHTFLVETKMAQILLRDMAISMKASMHLNFWSKNAPLFVIAKDGEKSKCPLIKGTE